MSSSRSEQQLVADLVQLAAEAGRLIRGFAANGLEIRTKQDLSPVTNADVRAEELLMIGLDQILPGVPVLAEEQAADGGAPAIADTFLVIDPLDGTKEFVAGRPDYTVNIALVTEGRAKIGILHAPARGRSYWGVVGRGAARATHAPGAVPRAEDFTPISTRPRPQPPVALTSLGHNDAATEAYLDALDVKERRRLGSALKFGLVAEGSADVYARFGATMEWDTAAGEALLTAAGGAVLTPDGQPLAYGRAKKGFRNGPFIAWGRTPERE